MDTTIFQKLNLDYPGLEAVKTAYFAHDNELAKQHLQDYYVQRNQPGFLGDAQVVFDRLKTTQQADILRVADQLVNYEFIFDQPWDMEKSNQSVKFKNQTIDWAYQLNDDPEWTFMLNRQNYWLKLVQAYVMTDKVIYLETFMDQMQQWLVSEPSQVGKENTTWRTIDTGIRLKNWTKILDYLIPLNVLPAGLLINILESIYSQSCYLVRQFSPEKALSNWRILEYHGVLIANTFFPELKEAHENTRQAIGIMAECLELQVTNDGFHWEQSFMYHHEVLLNSAEAYLIGSRNGYHFPESFKKQLEKMYRASTHITTPDYQQICYGDSDLEDLRHLHTFLSLVIGKCFSVKTLLKTCDLELLLDYGSTTESDLARLVIEDNQVLDYQHEDVGNYFLRSSWRTDGNFLFFKNGFLGSGHGHSDLQHIELYAQGAPILVDSGRFTYKSTDDRRQFYKSARAHNGLMVDQQEYTLQKRAWGTSRVATAIKRPVVLNQDIDLVQGAHLGYIDEGIFVNRKVIYIKPNIWIVCDEVMAQGNHQYSQSYHFATSHVNKNQDNSVDYQTDRVHVNLKPIFEASCLIEPVKISQKYNEEIETIVLRLNYENKGNQALTTVITDQTKQDYTIEETVVKDMQGNLISSEYVTAVRISSGSDEWLIVINHVEEGNSRKIYRIDGQSFYGRTGVIHQQEGMLIKRTVLEY